jgi:hypothetical protein
VRLIQYDRSLKSGQRLRDVGKRPRIGAREGFLKPPFVDCVGPDELEQARFIHAHLDWFLPKHRCRSRSVQGTEQIVRMENAILRNMRARPGVSKIAVISALPREGAIPRVRRFKNVSPGYFAAVGTRLIAGRDFNWDDNYSRLPVAIVSENPAHELWGDWQTHTSEPAGYRARSDWGCGGRRVPDRRRCFAIFRQR